MFHWLNSVTLATKPWTAHTDTFNLSFFYFLGSQDAVQQCRHLFVEKIPLKLHFIYYVIRTFLTCTGTLPSKIAHCSWYRNSEGWLYLFKTTLQVYFFSYRTIIPCCIPFIVWKARQKHHKVKTSQGTFVLSFDLLWFVLTLYAKNFVSFAIFLTNENDPTYHTTILYFTVA